MKHILILLIFLINNCIKSINNLQNKNKDLNDDLITSVKAQDIDKTKLLLEEGSNINHQDEDGYTALMHASKFGYMTIAQFLIGEGANINLGNSREVTALILASQSGHMDILKLLIGKGASVDDKNVWEVLRYPCLHTDTEIVELVLERFPKINLQIEIRSGIKILIEIVEKAYLEIILLFLAKGVDFNQSNNYGETPLMAACEGGNLEIVELLIKKGVNINARTNTRDVTFAKDSFIKGGSALLFAARSGHLEVVRLLVEKGANINFQDGLGETALCKAASNKHLEVVRLLLKKGANANLEVKEGMTALMAASKSGNLEIVKLLVEKGVNINQKNANKKTALMFACEGGNLEIVKLLIQKGANVNDKDVEESILLIIACRYGHLDIVKLFIEKGANVNYRNKYKETPLMHASRSGNIDIVRMLLEKKADINSKDTLGRNALMHSFIGGNLEIIKLLIQKGADVNRKEFDGDTPLTEACKRNFKDIVILLIEKGADVLHINIKWNDGPDLISWVLREGHIDIAKLILPKYKRAFNDRLSYLSYSQVEMVKFLHEEGFRNKNSLGIALRKKNRELIMMFLESSAFSTEKARGETLIWAVKEGDVDIVKALKHSTNYKDDKGCTALMWAIKRGHTHILNIILVDAKPNINLKDNTENTSLDYAAEQNNLEIAEHLLRLGVDVNRSHIETTCFAKKALVSLILKLCESKELDTLLNITVKYRGLIEDIEGMIDFNAFGINYKVLKELNNAQILPFKFNTRSKGRRIALLLGGLHDGTAEYMVDLSKALKGKDIEVIDGIDTFNFQSTISEQADQVFGHLKCYRNITNKDRIIIIGHSQGGLRGYALYNKYSDELNILGLFTLSSPWSGAKILDSAQEMRNILQKYHDTISKYVPDKYKEFKEAMSKLYSLEESPGVLDMKKSWFWKFKSDMDCPKSERNPLMPLLNIYALCGSETDAFNSSFLTFPDIEGKINEIKKEVSMSYTNFFALRRTAATVDFVTNMLLFPFFLYGKGTNYSKHVNAISTIQELLCDINKTITDSIGSKDHDGVLSLEEQYFNPIFKEKDIIAENFLIKDAYHGPLIPVEDSPEIRELLRKAIYNHPKAIEYIIETITKNFPTAEIEE